MATVARGRCLSLFSSTYQAQRQLNCFHQISFLHDFAELLSPVAFLFFIKNLSRAAEPLSFFAFGLKGAAVLSIWPHTECSQVATGHSS